MERGHWRNSASADAAAAGARKMHSREAMSSSGRRWGSGRASSMHSGVCPKVAALRLAQSCDDVYPGLRTAAS